MSSLNTQRAHSQRLTVLQVHCDQYIPGTGTYHSVCVRVCVCVCARRIRVSVIGVCVSQYVGGGRGRGRCQSMIKGKKTLVAQPGYQTVNPGSPVYHFETPNCER